MKKIYAAMKTNIALSLLILSTALSPQWARAQQSYTFTSAGVTGSVGPTQAQINTAYLSTNLNGSVVISPTAGIQTFTVPSTMGYRIEAYGAQGVGTYGGRGAKISGEFTLTAGTVLKILVGQAGQMSSNTSANYQYGGGGGSYVTNLANAPYIVAGGGGGSWATSYTGLSDGTITANGNPGITGTSMGTGGTGGGGGGTGNYGDGGAGITGDGAIGNASASSAKAFINGGTGGTYSFYGIGGFGGGGGTSSYNNTRCGGGGGYSGGGGVDGGAAGNPQGGGGGSFNSGVNQINLSGQNIGDGKVVITELCNIKITASGSTNSLSPVICAGTTLTLTTNAVSGYSWSTGNTTSSVIVVTPSTNTVLTVFGTSSLACQAYGSISITVSNGLPTLTVTTGVNPICNGASTSLTASGALTYTWTGGVTNGVNFTPSVTTSYTVTGQNGCGSSTAARTITVAPLVVNTISSPTLVCQGYTTALTAVSSVGGYTWQPGGMVGASVISAPTITTVYTVSASDGTCSGTQTVLVTTKTTPTITTNGSAFFICEGQSLTLSASGAGTGGTYTWSPNGGNNASATVAPLASTLYIVAGTNTLGCTSNAQVPVVVQLNPVLSAVANKTLICNGGTATLTAGGAGTYTWTGGPQTNVYSVNPTAAMTVYTVMGTSATNTCIASQTIAIAAITPSVNYSASISICAGQTGTLTASGATSYTWSGIPSASGSQVFSPAATTVYTLLANTQSITTNCPSSYVATIVVNQNPTVTVSASKTVTICKGVTNTLTANGAATYSWSNGSTNTAIAVSPSVTTMYTVTGSSSFGCSTDAQYQVLVSKCSGIQDINNPTIVSVFPNPNSGDFYISTQHEMSLTLINSIGQVIRTIQVTASNNYSVDVKDLSNGIYFLLGENGPEKINVKIVVAK